MRVISTATLTPAQNNLKTEAIIVGTGGVVGILRPIILIKLRVSGDG